MTPFQQAFADARAAGKKEFEFGGKPYHTRMKGEKAPPARTAKATVSQTVRPTGTTTTATKKVATKPAASGAIPTIMARPKMDAAERMRDRNLRGTESTAMTKLRTFASNALKPKAAVVAKTTSSPATGRTTTTMAALKSNKRDFSKAAVAAKKMTTLTGPKVARKK